MTFYTGRPVDDLPVSGESPLGSSLAAEVAEGFNQGPIVSWGEQSRLDRLNADPSAERVTKEAADAQLKQYRINTINVPAHGVTKQYLDAVIEDHQSHLNRQQILQTAPSGVVATPLKFMANLAGNMADPGNLAVGAIPFLGEARAATVIGRAGQRFVQGAGYGAAQTAVTMPFVAEGQAAQGNDFTMGDIASNMLLGTIGGGIIHAGGGLVADALRARDMSSSRVDDVSGAPVEKDPLPENGLPIESPAAVPLTTRQSVMPESQYYLSNSPAEDLSGSIERYRRDYAYRTAWDDVAPDYVENLQGAAGGQISGVSALREQVASLNNDLGSLDESLKSRTREYQDQRMTYRDARSAARKDIEIQRQQMQGQIDDLNSQISNHETAAKAAQELSAINKGNASEELLNRIGQRADEIQNSLRQSPIAQGVKSAAQRLNEADWMVRNQALRSAVAQMRRGEDVNIEPFLDLVDPSKKATAVEDLSTPRYVESRPEDVSASQSAEAQVKASGESNSIDDQLRQAEENLEYARQLNEAIANDDPEFAKLLKQANEEANDTSMEKAIKAAAVCRIGKMNG